jgi:hypothetical protein
MIERDIMEELIRTLDEHELDCRCAVCVAYVNAPSPELGAIAAANLLAAQRNRLASVTESKYIN